jgi:hypothetical protein
VPVAGTRCVQLPALSRFAVTVVVLVLVVATSAAFALTERLKLERSPITAPAFTRDISPECDCETAAARLELRFRRAEVVTATIVDLQNRPVQVLAVRDPIPRGTHAFVWNGQDESGTVVPDGRYRLRLRFERERRSILVPTTIRVDTKPPRLRRVNVRNDTFSPDGDGRADKLVITYRTGERAFAELVVDGRVVARTRARERQSLHKLEWRGTFRDPVTGERRPARRGTYEAALVVRDVAGNEASETFPVRVRFIELDQNAYEAQVGGVLRFVVDTDALTFRWFLFRPRNGGLGRPVLSESEVTERDVAVVIPSDARPGTYVLRVEEARRRARANVAVSAPTP